MEHGHEVPSLLAEGLPLALEPSGGDLYLAVADGDGPDAVPGEVGGAEPWPEAEHIRGAEGGEHGGAVVDIHDPGEAGQADAVDLQVMGQVGEVVIRPAATAL